MCISVRERRERRVVVECVCFFKFNSPRQFYFFIIFELIILGIFQVIAFSLLHISCQKPYARSNLGVLLTSERLCNYEAPWNIWWKYNFSYFIEMPYPSQTKQLLKITHPNVISLPPPPFAALSLFYNPYNFSFFISNSSPSYPTFSYPRKLSPLSSPILSQLKPVPVLSPIPSQEPSSTPATSPPVLWYFCFRYSSVYMCG